MVWCPPLTHGIDLPKRVIAVAQATVTHILSFVPVIPKYSVPLSTAEPEFERAIDSDKEVRGRGATRITSHPPMVPVAPTSCTDRELRRAEALSAIIDCSEDRKQKLFVDDHWEARNWGSIVQFG